MAGHDEEGVEPQGQDELHQPGHDVTGRQAKGELDDEQRTHDPEVRPDRIPGGWPRAGLGRPVPFELRDLPGPQRQPGQAYTELVNRVARDPEYGMQPEHAVEERLLNIRPRTQIGMVQQHMPIGSDQARADVVDVEERFSERKGQRRVPPLPFPVQIVMSRTRQRGSRHHHDDDECPGGYHPGDQEGQRGDMQGNDNPRHEVKHAVVPSQRLLGELGVDPLPDRRQQAPFVPVIKPRQIRRRVEFRRQQEWGDTELGQYVPLGWHAELSRRLPVAELEGRHQLGSYVLPGEFFDLISGEYLLQRDRIPVICVEQGADVTAFGLREPHRTAGVPDHPLPEIVGSPVDDPERLVLGQNGARVR